MVADPRETNALMRDCDRGKVSEKEDARDRPKTLQKERQSQREAVMKRLSLSLLKTT